MIFRAVVVLACSTLVLGSAVDSRIKRQSLKIPPSILLALSGFGGFGGFAHSPVPNSGQGFASSWSTNSDGNSTNSTSNSVSSDDGSPVSSWSENLPDGPKTETSNTEGRAKRQTFPIPSIPTNLGSTPGGTPGSFASGWATSSNCDGTSNATSSVISSANGGSGKADSNAISNAGNGFASSFANSSVIGSNGGSDGGLVPSSNPLSAITTNSPLGASGLVPSSNPLSAFTNNNPLGAGGSDAIKNGIGSAINAGKDIASKGAEALKNNPFSAIGSGAIKNGIGSAINAGKGIVSKGVEAFRGVGDKIRNAINATYQEEKDSIGNSWNSIKDLIHKNVETGSNLLKTDIDVKTVGPKFVKNLVVS